MDASPSDLDFLRVQEAVRRGWLRREQASEALREGGPLLEICRRRGWLDASQARRLHECALGPGEPDSEDEPLGVGDVLAGRYAVERIFQGGFGRVFVCRLPDGGRAALKTLRRKHLENAKQRQMFLDEARRWIALGFHPNLVAAYGLEEHLRLPFLVMECVEGGRTFGDRLDQGSDWRLAVDVGRQVARGLAHAGKTAGLIHRDLKPINILFTPDGTAKVADFGLSVVRGQVFGPGFGTPQYMPPEQWMRPETADVRSDLYSFGLILYETAAGRLPFSPRTQEEAMAAHLHGKVPDPRRIREDIPDALARFILRCVEKDPAKRPRDFAEAVEALDDIPGVPLRNDASPAGPSGVDAEVNRSRNALALGDAKGAMQAAQAALKLRPEHVGARNSKALALLALGKKEEALQTLKDALRLDGGSSLTLVNLAYVSRECGRLEEALRWLEDALPLTAPLDLEGLLPILLDAGRIEEALRLCERILDVEPKSVPTWNHLSIARRRRGDVEGAVHAAERALALNPRHAKAWVNRANALMQAGRFGDVVESAQRALELDPGLAGAYLALAAALGELGRPAEARVCLSRGLQALPGNPLLQQALARF